MMKVRLMAVCHRQKITSAANPNRTPSSGLEMANQKEMFHSAVRFIFTLFSQAFEDRHFTERETSFGTLNEVGSDARDPGLRPVALSLPLSEQRELVRCPIGPAGWHGRRFAFARRKGFEPFVSTVWIRHEVVIVQLYAVWLTCAKYRHRETMA